MEPRRVWNPPNPYLTEHRELLGEPPVAEQEIYEDRSQSILFRNDSPDLGFRWSVNPYRGCFHACAYCISGDTRIAMANGRTMPIAEVKVGDAILGVTRRGRYHRIVRTRVLAHWETVKPAYRIRLEDGTQLVASGDHRFLTQRGWKHVTGEEQGPNTRPHLTLNNELLGTGRFSSPPAEDQGYREGYLCGIIRGDGLLACYDYGGRRRVNETLYRFRLALVDPEALERVGRYLSEFDVPTREFVFQGAVARRKTMHAIRTSARQAVERTGELTRWPATPSLSWYKGFLAGIFDAEGCYSRGILRICNTDPDIIACVTAGLQRLQFDCVVEERPRDLPIYNVRVRGGLQEHVRFFHTVDPAISRKKDITGQALKNRARLRIIAIEPLGFSLPMFDITTGTGNLIANGVVSHNCYARPTHEYLGMGAGTDFERKIVIKRRAPQLLEAAFRRRSWRGELVIFSGVTDCYQPLEAAWQLTRGCLEVCARYQNPVGIITKSLLIRRDIDVLGELARLGLVRVSFSIAFTDEQVVRAIEPGTPTIRKRFETMELLARAGIPVGIGVAPVIPGLNDMAIPALLQEARRCGATSAFHAPLRLSGSVRPVFFHRLKAELPLSAAKVEHRIREIRGGALNDSRFGHRFQGQGTYWDQISQMWRVWTKRLGFDRMEDAPRQAEFRVLTEPGPPRSARGGDRNAAVGGRPRPSDQLEFAFC